MTAVQAQKINVTTANSSNGYVLFLNYNGPGAPTATSENSDHKSYSAIQSLAFILNPSTSALDLVVADNKTGNIAVYPGDFVTGAPTTGTVIWSIAQGPGPASPDGLSVDPAGNLFVVNTGKTPQLWVFPAVGTGNCTALTALPNYAALCAPIQVNTSFASGQQLVETAIVPGGVANAGDVLLLTNSPATVLDYHFGTAGDFTHNITRTTMLTVAKNPVTGGLAFWPLGNPATGNAPGYTLLITNQTMDTIQRYVWSSTTPLTQANDFANNLGGNGHLLYKIKTGYQTHVPYAFVAESGSVSYVLQFGEGQSITGTAALLNTLDVHSGLNHPEGLALINGGSAAANACTPGSPGGGCNPTGLLSHTVSPQKGHPNASAALVESVCVVPIDPRVTYQSADPSTWSCTGATLLVNSVCPGFDTTPTQDMFIPGYMCGRSGVNAVSGSPIFANPAGFTLIKTLTNPAGFNNTYVDSVTDNVAFEPDCFPSAANNPTLATLLWGPVFGEGTFLADGHTNETHEVTDGCGNTHGGTLGNSLWGEGFVLNIPGLPAGLVGLVDSKYLDLETIIQSTSPVYLANNIDSSVAAQLSSGGSPPQPLLPATSGCVPASKAYFDFAQFETAGSAQQTQDLTIAAALLSNADLSASPITCDSIVTAFPGSFHENDGPPAVPPYNPAGQVRSGLANLYFTINSRILGQSPNTGNPEPVAWPPLAPHLVPPPPGPYASGVCTGEVPNTGRYPPPGGCPSISVNPTGVVEGGSVTVSWTLYGSTLCTLDSSGGDTTFNGGSLADSIPPSNNFAPPVNSAQQVVTATMTPGTYTYKLVCTGPQPATTTTATASPSLTVWAPVVVNVSPASVSASATGTATITMVPPAGATGCNLTMSGGQGTFTPGNPASTYQAASTEAGNTVNFMATCSTGASPGTTGVPPSSPSLTVTN